MQNIMCFLGAITRLNRQKNTWFSISASPNFFSCYSSRPLEGRLHVTLRAAIPIRFAVRNTLGECVRAIQLGFFAEKPRKTPRVSGGSVQITFIHKSIRPDGKTVEKA